MKSLSWEPGRAEKTPEDPNTSSSGKVWVDTWRWGLTSVVFSQDSEFADKSHIRV